MYHELGASTVGSTCPLGATIGHNSDFQALLGGYIAAFLQDTAHLVHGRYKLAHAIQEQIPADCSIQSDSNFLVLI